MPCGVLWSLSAKWTFAGLSAASGRWGSLTPEDISVHSALLLVNYRPVAIEIWITDNRDSLESGLRAAKRYGDGVRDAFGVH
jgi:hypothetical protein